MWKFIVALVALYVIYVIYVYIFGMNHTTDMIMPNIMNAKDTDVIQASSLPTTPFGQGVRWTMSFWLYVNDLNYRYSNKKHVFTKQLPGSKTPSVDIYIAPKNANLMMQYVDTSNPEGQKTVTLGVVPLRKWQQLTLVQDGNVLDVFMNGRVIFSSDPKTPVITSHGETVTLSKRGGWSGYRSKFQYSNYNQNMQEIRSSLDEGPLTMSWMNPLYYVSIIASYISHLNNRILTLYLPDPQKEAQKTLNDARATNKKKQEDADASYDKE